MNKNVIMLTIDEMPKSWYNVIPDLPKPLPPVKDPEIGPSRIAQLPRIYVKKCLEIDNSTERWIRIPEEVKEMYAHAGRPTPLVRAKRLERYLKTPARIYYKREDVSPTGSYKVLSCLPQAYWAAEDGYERLLTGTAGQLGSALAYAASMLELKSRIYVWRSAYESRPGRITMMRLYGAEVIRSPSNKTEVGRKALKKNPEHPGSLRIIFSEVYEDLFGEKRERLKYVRGSGNNHNIAFLTMIGLEVQKQLEMIDEEPDVLVDCVGFGGNFSGLILPFLKDRLRTKSDIRFLASQSTAAPNLIEGEYRYTGEHDPLNPLVKVYTLGDREIPHIYAEGIRISYAAPIPSLLRSEGIIEAVAYDEKASMEAAKTFMRTEGYLPAPESAYSIRAGIDEAIGAKEKSEGRVIVMNISGQGFMDMEGYQAYLSMQKIMPSF